MPAGSCFAWPALGRSWRRWATGSRVTDEAGCSRRTVLALDDRFRWTEEFPWMRASDEVDVPPLRFLHEHLRRSGCWCAAGGG